MQEIVYQLEVAPWRAMPRKPDHSTVSAGLKTFAENVAMAMSAGEVSSQSELARMTRRASKGPKAPGTKTINNALNVKHSTTIGTLESIADGLSIPLWVLFVPGLSKNDLTSPNRERFAAMVRHYLECDDEGRQHTESAASLFSAKERAKRS